MEDLIRALQQAVNSQLISKELATKVIKAELKKRGYSVDEE